MGREGGRAYGLGLSRDGHIAFAAAYIAMLATIGGFGVAKYASRLSIPHLSVLTASQPRSAAPAPVAYRAAPIPDPVSPHTIPFYPPVAMLNRQEGTVVLRLRVLEDGQVGDVTLVRSSGYVQLDAAALVEVGAWRYLPAVRHGHPIVSETQVAIRFKMAE